MSQALSEHMDRPGLLEASVNRMHNLERRCLFLRPGNFNSIWQLLGFQDNNAAAVFGYRQGWRWGAKGHGLVA